MARTTRQCVACGSAIDPEGSLAMRKDGFDLVRCSVCGLLMRGTLPTRGELAEIYSDDYFRHSEESATDGYADYLSDADLHRDSARRRLRLLGRFSEPRGTLLDVGAAAGFFVSEATLHGWRAEGIDIAEPMVRWGSEHLGASVRHATLAEIGGGPRFAAITMWDYIEHAVDPRAEIERCEELLEPGGILALSTGDLDSVVARVSGSRWHLLTPRHHNYFFSASTLRRLLERCGFEVLSVDHPGSRYSLSHLIYKLERSLRLPMVSRLSGPLRTSRVGRVSIPVNLFDITTVVARKPGV